MSKGKGKGVKKRKISNMKRLWSIFTDNMRKCIFSKYEDPIDTPYPRIERHHVFGGAYKLKSEKYGYIAPLLKEYHPNGSECANNDDWKATDLWLKQICQKDYESKHGTREDFIEEFGRNYL